MRLTVCVASIAVLAACSSKTANSASLSLQASNASAPADGVTAITLTVTAVAADGVTPFSGPVSLSCLNSLNFGGGGVGGDTVTLVNGTGTDTVTCSPGANCVGSNTIRGTLSGAASATAAVTVQFTAVSGSSSSSSSSSGSATGTSTGTSTSGGTGTSTSGSTSGTTGDGGMDAGMAPVPGAITALTPLNPFMGVDYQTAFVQNVENEFSFQVTDGPGASALAVPGVLVTISADPNNAAGSYLVGGDGGEIVAATGDGGVLSVFAHSGSGIGTVKLLAAVNGTAYTASVSSQVVGTQPSVKKSSISCTPTNVPVFTGPNFPPCSGSLQAPPVTADVVCTAQLVDRFGHDVAVPVSVNFYSEAGSIQGSTVQTPAFGQPNAGQASVTINPSGNGPVPVTPQPGEPALFDPNGAICAAPHIFSPRQGLVTVLAVFNGEEPFDDSNASVWSPGVMFSDYPAPFVDANDNSVFDIGDTCISPVSGGCLGPNGTWDANTSVYVQTRVFFTGSPITFPPDAGLYSQDTAINLGDGGNTMWFAVLNGAPTLDVPQGSYQTIAVTYGDMNLNFPTTEDSATFACGQTSADSNIQVALAGTYNAQPGPNDPEMTPNDTRIPANTNPVGCDAGVVTTDAGGASTLICHPSYSVTAFKGGFTTHYVVSDSMNMNGPQAIDIRATYSINGAQVGDDLLGIGE